MAIANNFPEKRGLNEDDLNEIMTSGEIVQGNFVQSPNCYSTSETIIGRWVDGKPLYQKTWIGLNVTPGYNAWTNVVNTSSLNIDRMIFIKNLNRSDGHLIFDGGGLEFFLDDDKYIKAEYSQNVNRRTIHTITIQYTKTTD